MVSIVHWLLVVILVPFVMGFLSIIVIWFRIIFSVIECLSVLISIYLGVCVIPWVGYYIDVVTFLFFCVMIIVFYIFLILSPIVMNFLVLIVIRVIVIIILIICGVGFTQVWAVLCLVGFVLGIHVFI